MINQTLTPLTTPPSSNDVVNFDNRADEFLSELPIMVNQMNTVISQINNTESVINTNVNNAITAAQAAGVSADEVGTWTIASPFSVATIGDLSTIDINKYNTAIVKDLNRGGTFIWSPTGTANGGTVFAGITGYWNRQYSGAVNVKWFGAETFNDRAEVLKAFKNDYKIDKSVKVGNSFLSNSKTNQVTSNLLFEKYKGISILGDSITHGAFALNSFTSSWGRLFQRMANNELNTKSYGVINFLSLGSGVTASTDIHSVSFSGTWSTGVNSLSTLIGSSLSNSDVGSEINVTIPKFQNNFKINYVTSPTNGVFEVYINGVLSSTINSSGTLNPYSYQDFPLTDNGKGTTSIKIKVVSGIVEISTILYYLGNNTVVNLFATSGRKLRELTDSTIDLICANSSTLILALGHNDTFTTELVSRVDRLIAKCNENHIQLVIPDFRWNSAITDSVRQELYRLHQGVKNSIYIPFPELFKNTEETVDGTYTVSTLGLFTDASHPNVAGHKLIAETIAKEMKFSVSSSIEALRTCNYLLPLSLNTGTTVENITTISSVKWDNSALNVSCLIRMSPSGAFPTGTHIIQTKWDAKYGVPLIKQNWQGVAYIRNDTGEIVSIASLSSSGELKLYVLSSFITNQSFEFSVALL